MNEETGIVALEELPEKEIYLDIEPISINRIKDTIKNNFSRKKFANKIRISERILSHWLTDCSLIRLDIFKKIINFLFVDYEDIKIMSIRGKSNGKIENPKLPFNFTTKSGAKFIACMLGDGSLNRRGVFYSNTNLDLINGFIKDCKKIFGNVEISINHTEKKKSIVHTVSLPIFCKNIVNKLGLPIGPKVVNNPHIPNFIFNLGKGKIAEFISQIIDDEGSISIASRHIRIKFALIETERQSNLVDDLQKLFSELEIETSIYQIGQYNSSTGIKRKNWQIEIHSFNQLEKLVKILNLRHKEKLKKLKILLNSKKINHFPKKKCQQIYLSIMKKIQEQKGYFTSFDIATATNRNVGSCRNSIIKFRKLNLIRCIKPYAIGNLHAPAKYVIK